MKPCMCVVAGTVVSALFFPTLLARTDAGAQDRASSSGRVTSAPDAPGNWLVRGVSARRLVDGFLSPTSETRARTARALAVRGDAAWARRALLKALHAEGDPRVRRELLVALAHRPDPEIVREVGPKLAQYSAEESVEATGLLASVGTVEAYDAVAAILGRPILGDAARVALGRAGPPAQPVLLRWLTPTARANAVLALGDIGSDTALGAILPFVRDANSVVRRATAVALGSIGGEAAAQAVRSLATDADPSVASAAFGALARIGTVDDGRLAEAALERGPEALREPAFVALARLDPPRAATRALQESASGGAAEPLHPSFRAAVLASTHPSFVPVLERLVQEDKSRAEALDALANIAGDAGMRALLQAANDPALGPRTDLPLAVALRSHPALAASPLGRAARTALERAVRSQPLARALVLRALAQDGRILPDVRRALGNPDASARQVAAHAAELLGSSSVVDALAAALERESDSAAFRGEAVALRLLRAPVSLDALWVALEKPEIAPEAMELLAIAAPATVTRGTDETRLRRVLLRNLRSVDPRVRSATARALAERPDGAVDGANARLLAALLHDAIPAVRLAAARALARAPHPAAQAEVRCHYFLERDARVWAALRDARVACETGSALVVAGRGNVVLRVHLVSNDPSGQQGTSRDVLLPTGEWRRVRLLPGDDLVVADLPVGDAEISLSPDSHAGELR